MHIWWQYIWVSIWVCRNLFKATDLFTTERDSAQSPPVALVWHIHANLFHEYFWWKLSWMVEMRRQINGLFIQNIWIFGELQRFFFFFKFPLRSSWYLTGWGEKKKNRKIILTWGFGGALMLGCFSASAEDADWCRWPGGRTHRQGGRRRPEPRLPEGC